MHVGFARGSSRQTALHAPESGRIEFSTVLGASRPHGPPGGTLPASDLDASWDRESDRSSGGPVIPKMLSAS